MATSAEADDVNFFKLHVENLIAFLGSGGECEATSMQHVSSIKIPDQTARRTTSSSNSRTERPTINDE